MRNIVSAILLLFVAFMSFCDVKPHGMMMDPVNRSSAWRKGFHNPINYDDNANYCGGRTVQHVTNGGRCGVCGDDYRRPRPRANENGGHYGRGIIVKKYQSGGPIHFTIDLSANHRGWFSFAVCPLKSKKELETEECFDAHPIKLENNSYRYKVTPGKWFHINGVLPEGVKCEHCVIRWHYTAGNEWGKCEDGSYAVGCGPQETFRSCSDVSIL